MTLPPSRVPTPERPLLVVRCHRLRGGVDVEVVRPGDPGYETLLERGARARAEIDGREAEAFRARLRGLPWRWVEGAGVLSRRGVAHG